MTEEGENTFRISVLAVGEEVEVMDGGQPVTGVDDLFHRPARCLVTAWAVGILRRDDIWVRRNCLIPLEVEMQEYRHFCFDMVRQIHQQQGFSFYTVMAECDFDLFAGGAAVDRTVVVVQLLVGHIHLVRRHLSVYLFGKDRQQFRASAPLTIALFTDIRKLKIKKTTVMRQAIFFLCLWSCSLLAGHAQEADEANYDESNSGRLICSHCCTVVISRPSLVFNRAGRV